jgi:hypothetical protein
MLERYDLDRGPVYDDCLCTPGQSPVTREGTTTTLPPDCVSPDGTDCGWYERCLERKFPCSGDVNSYAIDYGLKFCNLYGERLDYFTDEGIEWVGKVRSCLQLALVPYIRSYDDLSCAELKEKAFDSHTPCYLDNGMCMLSCYDWAQAFWTIKGSLVDEFTGTVKQMLQATAECPFNRDSRLSIDICLGVVTGGLGGGALRAGKGIMRFVKFGLSFFKRLKRSTDECDPDCIARQLGKQVVQQEGWDQTTIDYVAFGNMTSDGDIEVDLLITDWELIKGESNDSTSLSNTAIQLLDDLESGEATVEIEGLQLNTASMCSDPTCSSSSAMLSNYNVLL